MQNFNFQFRSITGVKFEAWEKMPVQSLEFETRDQGFEFARNLSRLFKTEVRVTVCEPNHANRASGSYVWEREF